MSYPRIVGLRNTAAPSQLNVLLDLDECLLHTMLEQDDEAVKDKILTDPNFMEVKSRLYQFTLHDTFNMSGQGETEEYWGIFRPHLQKFMLFLFSHCASVSFWSAAKHDYVDECVQKICRSRSPYIVMNQDDIEHLPGDNYHKPLKRFLAHDPEHLRYENTIFIDDKGDNFISSPENGIQIPRYRPRGTISDVQMDDFALLQIRQWMLSDAVLKAKDIRTVDKSKIFTTKLRELPPTTAFYAPSMTYLSHRPYIITQVPAVASSRALTEEMARTRLIDVEV